MKKVLLIILMTVLPCLMLLAQNNLYQGNRSRLVVFARFNGDPDFSVSRTEFDALFNGPANSVKSYVDAVSYGKLNLNSLFFPQNTSVQSSFELKYCYYCYDNSWASNYAATCTGSDISTTPDLAVGFLIKELAAKLESSGELPAASVIDSDNDGYVDNFVVVLKGAGRGTGRGIYSPHAGTISSNFTGANGQITLNGKTIKNYILSYERNSLDAHCRFFLNRLGFPDLFRTHSSHIRVVGQWDPMDGPNLSYPLAYMREKYTNKNWASIPVISEPGTYSLNSVDKSTNFAYKLYSNYYPDEFWVLEYRNKAALYDANVPESGMIIYRVNLNQQGVPDITGWDAEVYVHRVNGTQSVAGDVHVAVFSDLSGRTTFGYSSTPQARLSDNSRFRDPDVSDIRFDGDKMTFEVNSVADVEYTPTGKQQMSSGEWKFSYSNTGRLMEVEGENICQIEIFNLSGSRMAAYNVNDGKFNASLPSHWLQGVYLVQIKGEKSHKMVKFIIH